MVVRLVLALKLLDRHDLTYHEVPGILEGREERVVVVDNQKIHLQFKGCC